RGSRDRAVRHGPALRRRARPRDRPRGGGGGSGRARRQARAVPRRGRRGRTPCGERGEADRARGRGTPHRRGPRADRGAHRRAPGLGRRAGGHARVPRAAPCALGDVTAVLVANRGEIARRIFRTARRMGFRTIAAYSDADAALPFVREADVAVRLGPAPARESYLDVERIVRAARDAGADFVHPGYGFLAEAPQLATAVADAGMRFVGPTPAVLAALGDK